MKPAARPQHFREDVTDHDIKLSMRHTEFIGIGVRLGTHLSQRDGSVEAPAGFFGNLVDQRASALGFERETSARMSVSESESGLAIAGNGLA